MREGRRRGQSCMAAEINFHLGRKPTEVVAASFENQVRRLRQIHLYCHVLQPAVVRPRVQQDDGSRIACEGPTCESINDEVGSGSCHFGRIAARPRNYTTSGATSCFAGTKRG